MEQSILNSVKKALNLEADYTDFDTDILMHVNSVFSVLNQLGVGAAEGYQIEDSSAKWNNFLGESPKLNLVKSYVFLKTRMLFDPPTIGYLVTANEKMLDQMEWRITVMAEEVEVAKTEASDALQDHINDPTPHPAYDNAEDFALLVENGLI